MASSTTAQRAPMLLSALLLAAALAGCFGSGEDPDLGASQGPDDTDEQQSDNAASESDPSDNFTEHEPVRVTRYLTADGGLSPEPPDEGRVDVSATVTDVFGASGWDSVTFASPAGENGTWIVAEDAEFELYFTPTQPYLADDFSDIVVHLGTSRSVPLVEIAMFSEIVLQPDEVYSVAVTLPFEEILPIYATPQESWLVTVSTPVTPAEGHLELLVGGEHASRITVTLQDPGHDLLEGLEPEEVDAYEGTLSQPGQLCGRVMPGVTYDAYTVEVPEDAVLLEAVLEQTGGSVESDLDVDFFLDGDRVGGGHTPTASEAAFFVRDGMESLRGETLDLFVTSCHSAATDYRLVVYMATEDPEAETEGGDGGTGAWLQGVSIGL